MKRITVILLIAAALPLAVAGNAYGGLWETTRSWLTGEVMALVASTILAVLGGVLGVLFTKVSRTFREAGEFLAVLGTAIEDKRITRDELADIIREGREVFAIWH